MALTQLFAETYLLDEKGNGSQRLINWYFEKYKEGSTKTGSAIVTRPGFSKVVDISALDTETCRGLYFSSSGTSPDFMGRLYGVWGNKVYRFNKEVTQAYEIGQVGDFGVSVGMTDNGFYFVVVDGVNMYKAPLTDADGVPNYSQVTLPVIPKTSLAVQPSHVAFIGQRLVINSKNTNYFFYSDFTSPTTLTGGENFDAASFYSAESSSDPILALKVVNGSLWVWGLRSYEIWRSSSNQDSPFYFVGGSSNAVGCEAPYSVATVGDMCFWLASSDVGTSSVYMGQGQSVKDITEGIYDSIRGLENRSSAIGYAFSDKGNIFYVLTFAYSNRSFCYDASSDKWHELLLRNVDEGTWLAYPYQYATVANGEIYAGLIAHDSCLVKMDFNKFTEWDGRMIVREGISIPFFENLDKVNLKQIMIDMEVGETGLLTGQGSVPLISMQISKDGGRTYGNRVDKQIGKQGEYRTMVRWNNCGSGRNLCFKVSISDPVPCSIYQARIEYEKWGIS